MQTKFSKTSSYDDDFADGGDACSDGYNNYSIGTPSAGDHFKNFSLIQSSHQIDPTVYNIKGQAVAASLDNLGSRTGVFVQNMGLVNIRSDAFLIGDTTINAFLLKMGISPPKKCCVENFNITLCKISKIPDSENNNKVGIAVNINATFTTKKEECECDAACCEYKQRVKGSIVLNGNVKTSGEPCDLLSSRFSWDCYGRNNFDSMSYDDNKGVYIGSDYPGLRYVQDGDNVFLDMMFESMVQDRCNGNTTVSEIKKWDFSMGGIVPNLNVNIKGVDNP